jgi:hypothetical protein
MIDSFIDFLIGVTLSFDNTEFVWAMLAMLVLCLGSVIALFIFIRHGRIMQDTPTSKIRSASQGFVELEGRARSLDDKPLRAPGSGRECVWYEYLVEKKSNDWEEVARDTSIYSFYVDDGTGVCAVDPEVGKVITRKKQVWTVGDRRYTERLIAENEMIYCLGQFETDQGGSRAEVIKIGVRVLLNQWKQDRSALLKRFDLNGDGDVDMGEWNQAREAAIQQVKAEAADDYVPTQHHNLVKPFNKSHPYIISSIPQDELTSRYKYYTFGLLGLFLLSGAYAVFMAIVRRDLF